MGGVFLLYLAIHYLRLYARRSILGRARRRVLQEAFPDFCYQPYADPQDIAGLSKFPALAEKLHPNTLNILFDAPSEIYNLIDDHQDNIDRSIFDLRTASKPVSGGRAYAETNTVFLINLPEHTLTPFSLVHTSNGDPQREAVIKLFDKSLVDFFRVHSLLFTYGSLEVEPNVILFHHAQRLDPEGIRSTLDILTKLTGLLIDQSGFDPSG